MAKLINVMKNGNEELEKRQLPLVIDEKLTVSCINRSSISQATFRHRDNKSSSFDSVLKSEITFN